MTRLRPGTRRVALAALMGTVLLLGACSSSEGDSPEPSETPDTTAVVEPTPSVAPVTADSLRARTKDPGLSAEWIYQGTRSGSTGGSVMTFLLHNTGDEPIKPGDIPSPKLTYTSGGTTQTAEPPATPDPGFVSGLDLPLGADAATNVRFAFGVAPGNLWDARVQVGNVIFEGNLTY